MASRETNISRVRERLETLRPTISRIREATGAASVSYGVVHQGEIVLQGTDGWRDAANKPLANIDTAYIIGSTMKSMIASCCGMLVDEGKLSWNDKLSQHLPFHFVSDPTVANHATIRDALSHTTSVAQLDLSWYGASGKNLADPQDLLHVVAHLPLAAEFRSEWSYCNYMYVIEAKIISTLGECGHWSSFLTQRVLEPLQMDRSKLSRDDFPDENIAEPHYVKDDGSTGTLLRPDLSANTLMGPACCLWSTVPNMLKWVQAVLSSISSSHVEINSDNLLKQMSTITAHQSLLTQQGLFENTYGYGWSRLSMPSPMFGFMSTNGADYSKVPGKDSQRRLMLYHGGQVTDYLTTLCIFPETDSAIIVLSNSQALGDASDWTVRAIMQELFQLSPPLDFIAMALCKAEEALGTYDCLMEDYRCYKSSQGNTATLDDKFGRYCNKGLKLYLYI